ncbi:MAG: thioether cross-link-forming SCIFF peptide maturase [Bacillota bacterium]|nr:thioether cross-link-forming SCIFF peptide maturase [Bacillota bacterium]
MIHKFAQGGLYFVLDVDSGAIHMVEEIVFDALDYYPAQSAVDTVKRLLDKYEEKEIKEAISEIDELIENELLYAKQLFSVAPDFKRTVKALCLNVAHDCNMRCKYCFASQGEYEGARHLMPFEVGKAAFDFLVKGSEGRRNLEVDFFGGEPLMNFGVVKQLVAYGRELEVKHNKHFRFTITTNGLLLDDEKIDYINEHMDNVVMSLDGRKEINDSMRPLPGGGGTHDLIIPKFKRLIEKRGDKMYYLRGTFTADNADFFEDVKHMAGLGFENISVEPVVTEPSKPYALRENQLEEIFAQYEALAEDLANRRDYNFFHFNVNFDQGPCMIKRISGCGAGLDYLAVTPTGDIYPCHQFVGNDEFKLGDVFNGISPEMLEKVEKFGKASALEKEECKSCWAKYYCSGGCHANAYNMNADIMVPYRMGCKMEKKRIECGIYLYGKRKLEELEAE